MEIQITVKVLSAHDAGKPEEPSLDDVVEFVRSLQNLDGVTVTVE